MTHDQLYNYRAQVRSVYDGDTCRADIDLGLSVVVKNEPLRLARINAPELRGSDRPQGLAARDFLRDLIDGHEVLIQTKKDDKGKYGRYIVEIWRDDNGTWRNVNDELVAAGHAQFRDY